MKKSVVDINDLQEAAPFFKSRIGTFLGKLSVSYTHLTLPTTPYV